MTFLYVVSNDETTVEQSILNTVGGAVKTLGDAMHLQDQMPETTIFVIRIEKYETQ